MSGASLNPAIAIIGNLFGYIVLGDYKYIISLLINAIAPLCGCIVFSIIFRYMFEPLYSKLRVLNHAKDELCNEDNVKKELRISNKYIIKVIHK